MDEAHLDVSTLADRVGVEPRTIEKWRAMPVPPTKSHKNFRAIAEALGKTPQQLDAAWKGEAADAAAPAEDAKQEKPMYTQLITDLARMTLVECELLEGLIARRKEQVAPATNARGARRARTAS